MDELLQLLAHVLGTKQHEVDLRELLRSAKAGNQAAALKAMRSALEAPEDVDLFIDDIAPLNGAALQEIVKNWPADARRLLQLMDRHLENVQWGYRDFNYYNVPLAWIHEVAIQAAATGDLDLLEEACDSLFRLEPPWDRWAQARRTRQWLSAIDGDVAERVAEVLRDHPDAAKYYGKIGHVQDRRIRAVLQDANADK